MKVKRVLWLLSHVALVDMEPAIFEELGYEVYTPKIPLFDLSAGITYRYDKTLSIPSSVLERLNQVDFFQRNLDEDIYEILNAYFDVCIVGSTPDLLRNIINKFNGVIGYRAYGRIVSVEGNHTSMIVKNLGVSYLKKIDDMGKRFFFLQISENIDEIECECFKRRSRYIPIGFKKGQKPTSEWRGTEDKLLFVCPRISVNEYFKQVYKNFIKEFKGFDYVIAGSQPVQIENDKNITGYLENKEYRDLFLNCKVMFYHSQELRHIHYHPLEAIMVGMPLVYMAGGHLDVLGGSELPGRCKTYAEARKKIKRIMKGDRRLIKKIVDSQNVLVEKYDYEYCKDKWVEFFDELGLMDQPVVKDKKKVAFILPAEYTGGVLDFTIRLAQAVFRGAKGKLDVVVGYLEHENYRNEEFTKRLEKEGIATRKFKWEVLDHRMASELFDIYKYDLDISSVYGTSEYIVVLNDGMNYFMDCDYLVITSDRIIGQLLSLVPFSVISHDYIQRILPELFGNDFERAYIDLTRKADAIFTTTQVNKNNCINYVGVAESKVNLIPLFFDNISLDADYDCDSRYFVWSTNINPHKNHLTVLKALEEYYSMGGKLICYVTGARTEKLDISEVYECPSRVSDKPNNEKDDGEDNKEDYVLKLRNIIKKSKYLRNNIVIKGELPKNQYYKVLQKSRFFLHAGYADNGNGTAFDAGLLGVPTLSSDYAAMRNLNEKIGLGMKFFSTFDYHELAIQIKKFENGEYDRMIGSRKELMKHTVQDTDLCEKLYSIISNNGAL